MKNLYNFSGVPKESVDIAESELAEFRYRRRMQIRPEIRTCKCEPDNQCASNVHRLLRNPRKLFKGIFPVNFLTENSEETTGPKGRRGTAGEPGFPATMRKPCWMLRLMTLD
jgi:hypothetical protein